MQIKRRLKRIFLLTIGVVGVIVLIAPLLNYIQFSGHKSTTTQQLTMRTENLNHSNTADIASEFRKLWPRLKAEIFQELLKNDRFDNIIKASSYRGVGTSNNTNTSVIVSASAGLVLSSPSNSKTISDKPKISLKSTANTPTIQNGNKASVNSPFSKILSEPIINPFQISYVYNDPAFHCTGTDTTEVVIAIPSAPGNFRRRERMRMAEQTKFSKNPQNHAKQLFFLGSLDSMNKESEMLQEKIDAEKYRYKDIVQATFVDKYHNMTMKAALLLHWTSHFCPKSKYLIHVDDDVKVNITRFVTSLQTKGRTLDHFILGNRKTGVFPARDRTSKWGKYLVTESEWPKGKAFPPYALGGCYGMSVPTAGLLLEVMRRTKLLWLDDVFVTGVCAQRLGVPVFKDRQLRFKQLKG